MLYFIIHLKELRKTTKTAAQLEFLESHENLGQRIVAVAKIGNKYLRNTS
jgi:hypothetical protein